jgi:hypothetical protein
MCSMVNIYYSHNEIVVVRSVFSLIVWIDGAKLCHRRRGQEIHNST